MWIGECTQQVAFKKMLRGLEVWFTTSFLLPWALVWKVLLHIFPPGLQQPAAAGALPAFDTSPGSAPSQAAFYLQILLMSPCLLLKLPPYPSLLGSSWVSHRGGMHNGSKTIGIFILAWLCLSSMTLGKLHFCAPDFLSIRQCTYLINMLCISNALM